MPKAHCMLVASDPTTGARLLSATVNVYSPGTVTPIAATIYDKNSNVLANPLTSDATTGLIDFYLNVAQEVDLNIAKSGYATRTYSNVPVLDDASNDLTALLTTTGDIAYASAANTPVRLGIGSAGQVLAVVGGVPAWGTVLSSVSNILGADVNLASTLSFYDGPSMAQGTAGTWLAVGSVVVSDTAGGATFTAKLWDGTTVLAAAITKTQAANDFATITLVGLISNPAANLRISVNDATSNNGKIKVNQSSTGKDSTIYGVRIG